MFGSNARQPQLFLRQLQPIKRRRKEKKEAQEGRLVERTADQSERQRGTEGKWWQASFAELVLQ